MIPSGILQNSNVDNLPDISLVSEGSKQKAQKRPWTQEEDEMIK